MKNPRSVLTFAIALLLTISVFSLTVFGVDYSKDIYADEVDGYIWQNMSAEERESFLLGMFYFMSKYHNSVGGEKVKIATIPTLAQVVTRLYQNTDNRDKPVFKKIVDNIEGGSITSDNLEEETKPPKEKPNKIFQYSGSGMKTTRPFTVNSSWELQWDADGMIFQAYLYKEDGELADLLANQQGEGKGSSYCPKTGTFYLKINAMGNWTVKAVRVD